MKKILIGLMIITLMAIAPLGIANTDEGTEVAYENRVLGDTAITLDGDTADWADVDGVDVTLKPAMETGTGSHVATFKSTHDATKIYFLIEVVDKYYFYNYDTGLSHRNAPAFALSFPIDDGVNAKHMGAKSDETEADLNTTSGMVDILHWELDTKPGVKTGGSKGNAEKLGDGVANLDDEYSTTPFDRHDDNDAASNNLWEGAWSHTSDMKANGTEGSFVFELSRDLTSSDKYDVSFAEGTPMDVVIAYWSPNETTENKWTDDGHYVNSESVINMDLVTKEVGAPGFGLYLALIGLFVLVPIVKRRK